jgi:hypothetical protein
MLIIYEDKLVKKFKEKMAAYFENHRNPPPPYALNKNSINIEVYCISN